MIRAKGLGPVALMIAGGGGTACVLAATLGARVMPELALGLAGPLVSAVVSWQILERTHQSAPERLTNVLIKMFAAKGLLFGLYLVLVLKVLALRPMPFTLSFTGYYVALHVVEAVCLRRLLANSVSS